MKTWVKLYTEIIDDKKLRPFSWAERGILMTLIALAGRLDYRDANEDETGQLDTLQDVAWYLRCDIEELQEAVQKFIKCGMLEDRGGVLFLANYGRRQKRPPSTKRAAVNKRVKRHREKDKTEGVTTLHPERNEDVTQLERKSRIERGERKESDESAPPSFWELLSLCRLDEELLTEAQRKELWKATRTLEKQREPEHDDFEKFGRWWYAADWRGKKGDAPRPSQVQAEWSRFEKWRKENAGQWREPKTLRAS